MINLAWLIPVLPMAAFAIIGLFTRPSKQLSSLLSIGAIAAAAVIAYSILFALLGGAPASNVNLPWIDIGHDHPLTFGWQVDALTGTMLVVVTTVSLLVQIYSVGYMHGEDGFSRFFAYLSLFSAAMLGLVLANNLLTVYIFWEGVGLGSYLLIGYYYNNPAEPSAQVPLVNPVDARPSPASAAKKAFLTTRLGDFGFLIGILILWANAGTLQFTELAEKIEAHQLGGPALTAAAILIFIGAAGKSAQFPLHVWLPDAMEGPTPVSALIHAATMVAAGVYLVARSFMLFEASEQALYFVAGTGAFTAIFAATMGLVSYDIKRVMAYSTVSQLGYMMLALGAGSLAGGIFHLFTHAFFKALLFLTAGSVIHGVHSQDLREMGGLRRYMPVTFWTMVIGAISLAGIFPFAGFWSKDAVLAAASERAGEGPGFAFHVYAGMALVAVFMTAFYMFRVIFLTFFGPYRGHGHPHESPRSMTVPLMVLAVPSVAIGFWGAPPPFGGGGFQHFLEPHGAAEKFHPEIAILSLVLGLAGIGLAYLMYYRQAISPAVFTTPFRPLYTLFINKYYIDDLYQWVIDNIVLSLSRFLAYVFDPQVIDGIVNGVGRTAIALGGAVRRLQTGKVTSYAMYVFAGLAVISFFTIVLRTGVR